MKDNRGMSLVELLLTVAILALVIVGAATFMMTGSRSFAKGSADSNVQGEAELAVNQIEDLVIDVNGGVDYVKTGNTESLVMYHVEADASGLSVYKERNVTWDKTNNNIYSSEWTVDKDGSGVYARTSQIYADQLLAENVTDFNVDLSDIVTETDKDGNDIDIVRSVVIKVGCLDGTGKAAYATTPIITLRNRMMLSSSPETIFPNTPTPDDSLLLYISDTGMEAALPIRDRVTTVERGKVYNIFAMVNAGTNVNSLCDFTVEGETTGTNSTITPNGVHIALSVNAAEPNTYLKITASYTTNPSKKVSGWVKVIGGDGLSLKGVKIIPKSLVGYTPKYTSNLEWSDAYTPTDADIASLVYTWSVNKPEMVASMASPKREDLDLEVKPQPDSNDGEFIKIRITLVVYCGTTNQTVSDSVDFIIPKEGTGGSGDSLMERGKIGYSNGFHSDNWYSFKPPVKEGDSNFCEIVGYDYYVCDGKTGQRISAKDYLRQYIIINVNGDEFKSQNGGKDITYWLTVHKDLPADQEFWLKVVINFRYNDGTDWSYERMHFVSGVHLYGETANYNLPEVGDYSYFPFYYTVFGYYSNTWAAPDTWAFPGIDVPRPVPYAFAYEITYDYDAPAGVTIEPKLPDWHSNVDNGRRIKGTAGFTIKNETGKEWWEIKSEVKMHRATIKIYMKDYTSVNTYCYVNFD